MSGIPVTVSLQISSTTKLIHRIITAVVAVILLIIGKNIDLALSLTLSPSGFAFILQSGKYKAKFDSQVPELEFCDIEVCPPLLFSLLIFSPHLYRYLLCMRKLMISLRMWVLRFRIRRLMPLVALEMITIPSAPA
jgi:hypothetical protein